MVERWSETEMRSLVVSAQAGNKEAFQCLISRFRPIAIASARRVLIHEMAEDAVQDATIIAFRSVKQLADPERFAAWFAAILRNRVNRLSRQGAPTVSLDWIEGSDSVPKYGSHLMETPPPLPWSDVQEAIGTLPSGMGQLVRLYYLHGYSVGDLANYLSLPATTIKWQLHAARAALKRKLEPQEIL